MPKQPSRKHINRYKIAHMVGVAEYMRERAPEYGLDPDRMYFLGLIHDIGYLEGHAGHEEEAASFLEGIVCPDYLDAVRNHGLDLSSLDYVSPELFLLVEGDMNVDAQGYRTGFEGRIADIERRYGPNHPADVTCRKNIAFLIEHTDRYRKP